MKLTKNVSEINIINIIICYAVGMAARSMDHGMDKGGQGVTLLCWRCRREEGLVM